MKENKQHPHWLWMANKSTSENTTYMIAIHYIVPMPLYCTNAAASLADNTWLTTIIAPALITLISQLYRVILRSLNMNDSYMHYGIPPSNSLLTVLLLTTHIVQCINYNYDTKTNSKALLFTVNKYLTMHEMKRQEGTADLLWSFNDMGLLCGVWRSKNL